MVRGVHIVGLLTLALLGALPPAVAQSQGGSPVSFITIATGSASGVLEPARFVIRDEAGWSALWYRHAGPGAGAPPAVDFGRDMVIALFAGEAPETTTLSIFRIIRSPDRLAVSYTLRSTRPMSAAETGLSTPFHMVALQRSELPVDFFLVKTPPVVRRLP